MEVFELIYNEDKININKFRKIVKRLDEENKQIKISTSNKNIEEEIKNIEKAINIKDKYDRYSFIYDLVCDKLDEKINTNYCEFKDDICLRDREKGNNHKNGCCECSGRGKCVYLIDGVCTMKTCMACKIFTCKALRKKGIHQRITDFSLCNIFFDKKEKYILEYSFWTPKEIVLDRVMNKKYKNVFK